MKPLNEIIAGLWSPRAFDAEKPVPREDLLVILEAARWAPSCNGEEPWRYIVCDRYFDPNAWDLAFECLIPGNKIWAKNAPVLALCLADSLSESSDAANRFSHYDAGAASENLALEAHARGMAAHQIGGFDPDLARQSFSIPDRYECLSMIAIGHPAPPEILDEALREKEIAPRSRKPMETRFFEGSWGKPLLEQEP